MFAIAGMRKDAWQSVGERCFMREHLEPKVFATMLLLLYHVAHHN